MELKIVDAKTSRGREGCPYLGTIILFLNVAERVHIQRRHPIIKSDILPHPSLYCEIQPLSLLDLREH